jgi:Fe2+ or Zn2+ uptake regulation protein
MSIRQETVEKVLNILTEKPQTANEIANQYKPYKSCVSTVRRVLSHLARNGKVKCILADNKSHCKCGVECWSLNAEEPMVRR